VKLLGCITTIENYFLSGCSGLQQLTLPQNLTRMGQCFLSNGSGLKGLTLSQAQADILRPHIDKLKQQNPGLNIIINRDDGAIQD
jgi:hypothetical protein